MITPSVRRVLAPTALAAVLGSALAVAVNVATESMTDGRVWLVVGALTVLTFLASVWMHHRATNSPPIGGGSGQPPAGQSVSQSRVRGSVFQISQAGDVHIDGNGR